MSSGKSKSASSTISSGSRPELPQVDLSRASSRNRTTETLARKWFKVQLKGTLQVVTVEINATEIDDAFSKICTRVKLVKNKNAVILYPQRTVQGVDEISIENDEFLKESLMHFYLTCEEGAKLLVTAEEDSSVRDYRPNEYGYNTIVRSTFTVDKRFYEYLQENVWIVEQFLAKRKFINLILGKDCMNFLNPAYFLCHIKGCEKLIPLGSFNNVSRITNHIKTHSAQGDTSCKTVMRRHKFLTKTATQHNTTQSSDESSETHAHTDKDKKKKKAKAWISVIDLATEMQKLESAIDPASELPLEADITNKNFIEPDTTASFKGKHLLVNLSVLQKIVLHDTDALSSAAIHGVLNRNRIESYYTKVATANRDTRNRCATNNSATNSKSQSSIRNPQSPAATVTRKSPSTNKSPAATVINKSPSTNKSPAVTVTRKSPSTNKSPAATVTNKSPSTNKSPAATVINKSPSTNKSPAVTVTRKSPSTNKSPAATVTNKSPSTNKSPAATVTNKSQSTNKSPAATVTSKSQSTNKYPAAYKSAATSTSTSTAEPCLVDVDAVEKRYLASDRRCCSKNQVSRPDTDESQVDDDDEGEGSSSSCSTDTTSSSDTECKSEGKAPESKKKKVSKSKKKIITSSSDSESESEDEAPASKKKKVSKKREASKSQKTKTKFVGVGR